LVSVARRSTPKVSDAARRYIAHRYGQGGSEGVRYALRSLLTRFARAVNDVQVGSLKPEHVDDFFYDPDKGLTVTCARTTLGKYYNDLKGFLTFCHRRGWCDDPGFLVGGVVHTSTHGKRNRLRLSEAQLWSLVEHAPTPRHAAMIVFAMHTGCRISEILDVKVKDLNFELGELSLRVIKTHEEDVMRISPTFERYMREWLTVYSQVCHVTQEARLFPAARRGLITRGRAVPWDERGFNTAQKINNPIHIIRACADAAGIALEDGDGWHTVRRSVARIFFDKASHLGHDAALRMTSAFLHHKNTSTTERYLGLELEKVKRDEVMADGFLSDPFASDRIAQLDAYRKDA
jgi:integrase